MARLTECKDCGQRVSKKAKACPGCGAPVHKQDHIGCIPSAVAIALALWAISMFVGKGTPATRAVQPPAGIAQSQHAQAPGGRDLWVTSDRLNRRTCPSTQCGVVGRLFFREKAVVLEESNGWGRVTNYYPAECRDGRIEYVDEGNAACSPDNGVRDGRIAEWVSLRFLSARRPADPGARAVGIARLVSRSDDYRLYGKVFAEVAEKLITSGRCTPKDFEDMGGWVKSTERRDEPVYFTYCGSLASQSKIYLDAATGRVF